VKTCFGLCACLMLVCCTSAHKDVWLWPPVFETDWEHLETFRTTDGTPFCVCYPIDPSPPELARLGNGLVTGRALTVGVPYRPNDSVRSSIKQAALVVGLDENLKQRWVTAMWFPDETADAVVCDLWSGENRLYVRAACNIVVRMNAQGEPLWAKRFWMPIHDLGIRRGGFFTGSLVYDRSGKTEALLLTRFDSDGRPVRALRVRLPVNLCSVRLACLGDSLFAVGVVNDTGKKHDLFVLRTDEEGEEGIVEAALCHFDTPLRWDCAVASGSKRLFLLLAAETGKSKACPLVAAFDEADVRPVFVKRFVIGNDGFGFYYPCVDVGGEALHIAGTLEMNERDFVARFDLEGRLRRAVSFDVSRGVDPILHAYPVDMVAVEGGDAVILSLTGLTGGYRQFGPPSRIETAQVLDEVMETRKVSVAVERLRPDTVRGTALTVRWGRAKAEIYKLNRGSVYPVPPQNPVTCAFTRVYMK